MQSITSYPSNNKNFVISLNWESWNRFSPRNSPPSPRTFFAKTLRVRVRNSLLSTLFNNSPVSRRQNACNSVSLRQRSMKIPGLLSETCKDPRDFSCLSPRERMGLSIKKISAAEAFRNQTAGISLRKKQKRLDAIENRKILNENIKITDKIVLGEHSFAYGMKGNM